MFQRLYLYDVLRVCACFLIICMHSPIPNSQNSSIFLSTLSYLCAPGIGLFFMLSGALLLPIKGAPFVFLIRRISKVIWPTLFWTFFYLLANIILKKETLVIKQIISIPFSSQGHPILWFMYTLIGLYLLTPILSHWLSNSNKKEVEFYLGLWGISLCYPLFKMCLTLNDGNTGILYYFTGYAGYFILGYYCRNYSESLKWKWIVPAATMSILAPVCCKLMHLEVDFYDLFWYLSIFVAILCVTYYKLNETICNKFKMLTTGKVYDIVQQLSNLSFGIYLVHIFVMRYLLWKWDLILNIQSYYLQTLAVIILTFVGSALICYLISLLPGSQYVLGYKNKKK